MVDFCNRREGIVRIIKRYRRCEYRKKKKIYYILYINTILYYIIIYYIILYCTFAPFEGGSALIQTNKKKVISYNSNNKENEAIRSHIIVGR